MAHFRTASDIGVGQTFLAMGALYFLLMMFGVFTIRVPREGWKPENWIPQAKDQKLITTHNVDVNTAFTTPQFWLLWIVLVHECNCRNRYSRAGFSNDPGFIQRRHRSGCGGRICWAS
jgi:hypothetical protein